MTSRKKIILLLIVLMIISGLAGTCIGIRVGKAQARKRSIPEAWNVRAMNTLQRKLALTPEQASKVQAVLDSGVDELRALRTDTLERTDKVINRLVGEIEPVLTEEQRPNFHILVEERAKASLDEMLNFVPRSDVKSPKR
jgi:predicted Holliday junction resolvase-like endonuclease